MKKQSKEITITIGKQEQINGINYTNSEGITKDVYNLIYDYCDCIKTSPVSVVTMYAIGINKDKLEITAKPDLYSIKKHKWVKHIPTYVYIIMYNYYKSKADEKLASKLKEKEKEEMLTANEKELVELQSKVDEYHVAIRDLIGNIIVHVPAEHETLSYTVKDLANENVFLKVVNGTITDDFAKIGIKSEHKDKMRKLFDEKEHEYIQTGTIKPIEQIDSDIKFTVGNVFKDWSTRKDLFYMDYISPAINKGDIKSIVYTVSAVYVKPTRKDKTGVFKRQRDVKLQIVQKELAVQYVQFLERKANKEAEPVPVITKEVEPTEKTTPAPAKKTSKKTTKKTAPAKKTSKKAGITKNKETGKLEVVTNK